jgi:hypothetical protein
MAGKKPEMGTYTERRQLPGKQQSFSWANPQPGVGSMKGKAAETHSRGRTQEAHHSLEETMFRRGRHFRSIQMTEEKIWGWWR